MSSDQRSDSDRSANASPPPAESAELERQPIGGYLKRQRELRGISVEELAGSTRIPLRSLQRLEAGIFDDEVDGFVRGFVRTVAQGLGLDPDDTVSRMLSEPAADGPAPIGGSSGPSRMWVGLALLVLLAAAVGLVRVVGPGELGSSAASAKDEVVYRRDPVRALAESDLASRAARVEAPDVAAAPPPTP